MKAIIVDFDGDYLIVANSRGDFKRIYNNYPGCQVGDEITIKEIRAAFFGSMLSSLSKKKALMVAACFLFMIVTSYGIYSYLNPVTYVTIDINPSIELSLNRYDVVRDARSLNEDGNIIIGDGREYRNMKFDKALNLLLSRAVKANYLNNDANTVMLTVSNVKNFISSNKKKQLQEIAQNQLHNIVEKEENTSSSKQQDPEALTAEGVVGEGTQKRDVKIIVEDTTYEKHQEAKKMNISQGKLVLYEKLKKIKPDLVMDHIKEASIGQIIKEIETVRRELKDKSGSKASPNVNYDNKKQTDNKMQWINKDKQQQRNDIKQLKIHVKEQLKNIQEDHKNHLKEKIKDTQEQLRKTIKEKKKDISKEIKKELKNKIDTDMLQQYKNNKKDKKDEPHIFNKKDKINKNSSKNNKTKNKGKR